MFDRFKYFKEIYYAVGLIAIIVLSGTIGFMAIEDFTFAEGLYMTIITVSTVGFQEIKPLSEWGRYFTAFLIITSFGTFAYAITSITRNLLSGQYRQYFNVYKVKKEIESLQGHVIVCGYGRNGKQIVKSLQAYGKRFVIVENSSKAIEDIKADNELYVLGDATDEDVLIEAGINKASAIISALPKDADNVFVTLTARDINHKITIIGRASEDSAERKLRRAGANNVIMPEKVGGMHMASLVVTPDVYEFLDKISIIGSHEVNLEEVSFNNIPENCQFKTIADLNESFPNDCLIIGYKSANGEYVVNPDLSREILPGTKLFVLGKGDQILSLNKMFNMDV